MTTLIQIKSLPKVLSFSEIKYYIFSAVFTASAVFFPWLTHQFHIAGPTYLPMHFFVLIAGFLFGWRTGLLIGLISPLMSYSITHMPPAVILAETILELAVYGLIIGLFRERNFNIWVSLFLVMIVGRLARLFFVLTLGLKTNPIAYFQMSWPGIVLQIILIPFIVFIISKFILNKENE